MNTSYDAIIIGTGQAGPSLARRLSAAGMSVAIVERHLVGGTCVNTGCKPTKTLVASAYAAHLARRGADFGVITGPVRVDMARVHERTRKISADSRAGNEAWLRSLEGCDLIFGHARVAASGQSGGRRRQAHRTAHLRQCRRPGADPRSAGRRHRSAAYQFVAARHADAAETPRCCRRELHRPRIRPSLPALRRGGHDHRARPALDRPGGRRRVRGGPQNPGSRGDRGADGRGMHPLRATPGRCRGGGRLRAGRAEDRGEPRAPGGRPRAQHPRPRARCGRGLDRRARLHHRGRPARHQRPRHLGSGRLQRTGRLHAHQLQRFRDRRGQPPGRGGPQGPPIVFPATHSTRIHPSAAWA